MIGLDSWHPTRGTRLTGQRNTARRKNIEEGKLVPVQLPPSEREWEFARPIGPQLTLEVPFSEVILIARHLKPRMLRTYLSANALRDIRDESTPAPELDESGRSAQQFVVEVVARSAGQTRRIVVKGRDIYAFSASLICEAVGRLLLPQFDRAGAYAPGEILDATDILGALQPDHVNFKIFND